ncbi:hypothetical protein EI982_07745 [Haloplanus rallus]|uniref:Uncharacterized protein n=1 Tax=Haloplanus rallus TaxID=1816183 RepID=A0A6B9F8I3_9EURY|nr:hypothetical protein [Haloplanus rallus]QGX94694.1 hypothetical protein EI982_07745 [Haloplanus rallus]
MVVTSTVLDGVFCLLLISAAVVTVTTATPREPVGEGRAADVASTLATSTATVNYTLTPRTELTDVEETEDDDAFGRTAHGTLAELLARAAVGELTVGGRPLSHERAGLSRAVVRAVEAAVRTNNTRITAVWRPYPNASVTGRIAVGSRPPPDVSVHAATLTVPSGLPATRTDARTAAATNGMAGVADAVAAGVVDGLFPPTRTRQAAGGRASSLVRHRYRLAERRFGADGRATPADGDVDDANDRLAAALSERVARDLRGSNASASAAAERVGVGRVRIVVRTWP